MCVYIGSTDDMRRRYAGHVTNRNNPNSKQYNYQFYQDWRDVELNDFKFRILDVFTEVLDKRALEKTEQSYIDSEKPLCNGMNAFTGLDRVEYHKQYHKQYYELNKEYKKQYNKQYKEHNKDYYKQYREKNKDYWSHKIQCECGCMVTRKHISTHRKTQKHKLLMSQK